MAEAKISEPENSNVNSPKWHPKIKKKKINHKQSTEKLYFGMNHAIPL